MVSEIGFYLELNGQSQRSSLEMAKQTRQDLMIATWHRLGEPRVGKDELRRILRVLQRQFAERDLPSPALIARTLADEGAQLRHPEILEFDARWRESRLRSDERKFGALASFQSSRYWDLKQAEAFITELEQLRAQLEGAKDQDGLARLRRIAANARRAAELTARDRTADATRRVEQAEIAEWFKLWIQTPGLFPDWLELRKRSPEFRRRFEKH